MRGQKFSGEGELVHRRKLYADRRVLAGSAATAGVVALGAGGDVVRGVGALATPVAHGVGSALGPVAGAVGSVLPVHSSVQGAVLIGSLAAGALAANSVDFARRPAVRTGVNSFSVRNMVIGAGAAAALAGVLDPTHALAGAPLCGLMGVAMGALPVSDAIGRSDGSRAALLKRLSVGGIAVTGVVSAGAVLSHITGGGVTPQALEILGTAGVGLTVGPVAAWGVRARQERAQARSERILPG